MKQKTYNIEYLPSYYEELEEILYYFVYKLKNYEAFEKLYKKIEKAILIRSRNPESFEKHQSKKIRKHDWYKIYINNFVIFYTVTGNTMQIMNILYNKRNFNQFV